MSKLQLFYHRIMRFDVGSFIHLTEANGTCKTCCKSHNLCLFKVSKSIPMNLSFSQYIKKDQLLI